MIEALIGRIKTDGLLYRNWLKGSMGDAIHVMLCTAGQDLRLILRAIESFFKRCFRSLSEHDGRVTLLQWVCGLLSLPRGTDRAMSTTGVTPSHMNGIAILPS